jgi:hypothetical protein
LDDQIKSISMIGRINLASSLAALQQRWSAVGTFLFLLLLRTEAVLRVSLRLTASCLVNRLSRGRSAQQYIQECQALPHTPVPTVPPKIAVSCQLPSPSFATDRCNLVAHAFVLRPLNSQSVLEELRVCVMFFAHLVLDITEGESQMYPSSVRELAASDQNFLGALMQVTRGRIV